MKRTILIGLLALLLSANAVLAEQTIIANDGFESGTFCSGTGWTDPCWTTTGSASIQGWSNPYEGNRHVWLRGSGASITRSTSTNSDLTIRFAARHLGFTGTHNAKLLVNNELVYQWNPEDTHEEWRTYEFNVTNTEATATIRYEANTANLGQEFHIDAIEVYTHEGQEPTNQSPPANIYEAGSTYYIETLENGQYRIVTGDSVTYYDGTQYLPVWRNIYNLTPFEFENYDLGVETLKYNAYFKEEGGNVQLVSFVSNNTRVIYQPQVIGWINIFDGRENIALPQTSQSTIKDNKIIYKDLYGTGIDLSYQAYGNFLRKEILIDNRSSLTPPSEFALSQGPVVFYAEYLLTISNVDRIIVDGTDWDFTSSVYTNNSISIVNTGEDTIFQIKEPYVEDANNQRYNATYQLFTESGSYRIRIIVPYETLWEQVTYPIAIDPTTGYNDTTIEKLEINLSSDTFNPLNKLTLYNASEDSTISIDVNTTNADYAINPEQAVFSQLDVDVKPTTQNTLLKCPSWNFTSQTCPEGWISYGDITPGENYNFTIWYPLDPGFKTINYTDTTNNTAYEGESLTSPPATNIIGTLATNADYAAIANSDDTRWLSETTGVGANDRYAWQRFVWNLTTYDLININITWEGYATAPAGNGGNGFILYALNTSSNTWTQLATSTIGTEATYNAQITDPQNYLNTNEEFILLVQTIGTQQNPGLRAQVYTDYIQLDVEVYCTPTINEDWIINYPEICDNVTRTTGTGNIIIQANGSLTLQNNANITTSGFPTLERWATPWLIRIERGSNIIITR